jgi:hypothetical protein
MYDEDPFPWELISILLVILFGVALVTWAVYPRPAFIKPEPIEPVKAQPIINPVTIKPQPVAPAPTWPVPVPYFYPQPWYGVPVYPYRPYRPRHRNYYAPAPIPRPPPWVLR